MIRTRNIAVFAFAFACLAGLPAAQGNSARPQQEAAGKVIRETLPNTVLIPATDFLQEIKKKLNYFKFQVVNHTHY